MAKDRPQVSSCARLNSREIESFLPHKIPLLKGLESTFALQESEQLKRSIELAVQLRILMTCDSLSFFFSCRYFLSLCTVFKAPDSAVGG